MNITFFGTPDYVIPVIEKVAKIIKGNNKKTITAVVTQKPKISGRKKILTYSSVDKWAHKRNIPIYYSSHDLIRSNHDFELGVLASYGEIIPKEVISKFKYGILNIHPSLLPKYRGASPVQAAILSGEKQTGISIIKLDEKLDHGVIISQFKEDVLPDDTSDTLRKRLFIRGAEVLVNLIPSYISGKITPKKQSENEASNSRQLVKEDGFIDPKFISNAIKGETYNNEWRMNFLPDALFIPNATTIERFVRAMQSWPSAWTFIDISDKKKRLKIIKSHVENTQLIPDLVQLEGKNQVEWLQFIKGYPNYSF